MSQKSKLWYLENFNLFSGLKVESMNKLDEIASMQETKKEEPVYFAKESSNSVYFLKSGRVKITKYQNDGSEKILAIINPGEIFGEMAYLDENERTDYAVTIEPSVICSINKNDLSDFVSKNPSLSLKLTKIFGLKVRTLSERVEDLIFKDADHRVVSFILRYADKNGKLVGDKIYVRPFLKHQHIGELTACSRQTVNYILTDLRTKKVIDFDRNKLIINNLSALKSIIS
jgi:CRP/FNR family transcriptional regulator, cyclic AMP receptor protein